MSLKEFGAALMDNVLRHHEGRHRLWALVALSTLMLGALLLAWKYDNGPERPAPATVAVALNVKEPGGEVPLAPAAVGDPLKARERGARVALPGQIIETITVSDDNAAQADKEVAQEDYTDLTVVVVDQRDQRVPDASVHLECPAMVGPAVSIVQTTDESGEAKFYVPQRRGWAVTASKGGDSSLQRALAISLADASITLRLSQESRLIVLVMDLETCEPVEGATVEAESPWVERAGGRSAGQPPAPTTTDASGRAILTMVAGEPYQVRAYRADYRVAWHEATGGDSMLQLSLRKGMELRVKLDRWAGVPAGKWLGSNGERKAAEWSADCEELVFRGLPSLQGQVVVEPGEGMAAKVCDVDGEATLRIEVSTEIGSIKILAPPESWVRARRGKVFVKQATGSAPGVYDIDGLPPDTYEIWIVGNQFGHKGEAVCKIELIAGQTATWDWHSPDRVEYSARAR